MAAVGDKSDSKNADVVISASSHTMDDSTSIMDQLVANKAEPSGAGVVDNSGYVSISSQLHLRFL